MGLVQHVYQRGVFFRCRLINFIDPMRQSLASPTFTVDKPSNCKKKSTRANWDKDFFH